MSKSRKVQCSYLFFTKIIRQVGDHDLHLAWHSVLRWATLLARSESVGLAVFGWIDSEGIFVSGLGSESLIGGRGEWGNLAGDVGWAVGLAIGLGLLDVRSCGAVVYCETYTSSTTSATTASTSTAATTG